MAKRKTSAEAWERGHRIKDLREKRGLSQADLGLAVGVGNGNRKSAERSVQGWENDSVKPYEQTLTQLARVLETSKRYILDGVDEPDATTEDDLASRLRYVEGEIDRRKDGAMRGGIEPVVNVVESLRGTDPEATLTELREELRQTQLSVRDLIAEVVGLRREVRAADLREPGERSTRDQA